MSAFQARYTPTFWALGCSWVNEDRYRQFNVFVLCWRLSWEWRE